VLIPVVLCSLAALVAPRGEEAEKREITDPEEAKADPDFAIQGEYLGDTSAETANQRRRAPRSSPGAGEVRVVGLPGGLPGAGWKRGDPAYRCRRAERRHDHRHQRARRNHATEVRRGQMTLLVAGEEAVQASGSTEESHLGAKPPEGALVIFDGTNLDMFNPPQNSQTPHRAEDDLRDVTTKRCRRTTSCTWSSASPGCPGRRPGPLQQRRLRPQLL